MRAPSRLFIALAALCSLADLHSEVHWPEWLGPNRDGQVTYFKTPEKWPDGLTQSWNINIGEGSAMPIIANGRIYAHSRQQAEEVVWALDPKTGRVIWRESYPVDYRIQSWGTRHGNGPLSNPTFADGRLFTFSVTGILSAWDAQSGDLLWRRDYAHQFRQTHPDWGHSFSPLVDGDQVVVHFGGGHSGVLVALNVATGDVAWTEGEDGPSHASPILVNLEGIRQIVEWNYESVVGIESGTGKRLWDYSLPHRGSNQNSPTPVHFKGRLLIGGENRGIRSLEPKLENGEAKDQKVTSRNKQRGLRRKTSKKVSKRNINPGGASTSKDDNASRSPKKYGTSQELGFKSNQRTLKMKAKKILLKVLVGIMYSLIMTK